MYARLLVRCIPFCDCFDAPPIKLSGATLEMGKLDKGRRLFRWTGCAKVSFVCDETKK
jgi:hypothetical protein